MATERERTVCVTGGSGYLGSWVVKLALDQGFVVHTTTRGAAKAEFLKGLEGASERLKIFDGCDLLQESSFDAAIEGCDTVIHTASPFYASSKDDEGRDRLVKPAVDGTTNVLNACKRLGVKKVVVTSSTAAIYVSYGAKPAEHVFTEADWSDADVLTEHKNWYCLSKVLAEKAAWAIANEEGCPFSLAVMNPCLIIGPMLKGQPHLNTSCSAMLKLFFSDKIQQACMHLVDVRDVADAHLNAAKMDATWPGWGKRYLLVGASELQAEVVEAMRQSAQVDDEKKSKLPTELDEEIPPAVAGAPPPAKTLFDTSQSTGEPGEGGLGLHKYFGLQEMVDTTIESMAANGYSSMEQYTLHKDG